MANTKTHNGRYWKRMRRIEIVARLEAQFVSDADIAAHLGITPAGVAGIKGTPEYKAKRLALATQVLSAYDFAMLKDDEDRKQAVLELVPEALKAVKHVLSVPSHPQFARVALDILDRNKATSKISRTEHSIAPVEQPSEQNQKANELLAMLQGASTVNMSITIPAAVGAPLAAQSPEPDTQVEDYDPNIGALGCDVEGSD